MPGDGDHSPGAGGRPADGTDDEPVLPGRSRDEVDVGWGDGPGDRDDEWYRRERPPHHDR
jgi:hypothetical protein